MVLLHRRVEERQSLTEVVKHVDTGPVQGGDQLVLAILMLFVYGVTR